MPPAPPNVPAPPSVPAPPGVPAPPSVLAPPSVPAPPSVLAPPNVPTPPELQEIQHYIWVRYVNHAQPEQMLDEQHALSVLASYYAANGMDADAECFYFGILAFERSFAEPGRSEELLEGALAAFQAYRRQTRDGFVWDAVEDRYQDALERLALARAAR